MTDLPVLIVGGGPVGRSALALLSRLGVSSRLVERHPSTSIHLKARGLNTRTMEISRPCGVGDAVRAAGAAPEKARFIIWARSLAGEERERRVPWRSRPERTPPTEVSNPITDQIPVAQPGGAPHLWHDPGAERERALRGIRGHAPVRAG